MILKDWILPILMGIVSSYLLLSILFNNPEFKQRFINLLKNNNINNFH